MEKVNEFELQYRGGESGVKYLFRGPKIDWGVFRFLPGEKLGKHCHKEVEETFYFTKGTGTMVIEEELHTIKVGDAYRIEPPECHNIVNDGTEPLEGVFIKHIYAPKDKVVME
jgi:mannose-6-phosphate isomerase-like protein (cupin superfamily)